MGPRRPGLGAWRPPLRLAVRDLRRGPVGALVLVVLVALPVAVALVASVVAATIDSDSPNSRQRIHGTADAELEVTPRTGVRVVYEPGGLFSYWRPARGETGRRDPASVDLAALLPSGSRLSGHGSVSLDLATGGSVGAEVLDLADPLTGGLAVLAEGRAPRDADEVAVAPAVADAIDLDVSDLPDGGAVVPLAGGRELRVTGLLADSGSWDDLLVVPPAAAPGLRDDGVSMTYLVDLPAMTTEEQVGLARDLAAAGVSSWFEDAVEHPATWRTDPAPTVARSAEAAAVGALVIGLGLVEVVVIVGAAFAVQARRQSRSLGLLVVSGGSPADVRRTILARGVVVGVLATGLGMACGAAVLVLGRGRLGVPVDTPLVDYSVPAVAAVVIGVLGVVSAVLAAAVPAWSVARMSAHEALDGRVSVAAAPGRARPHRFRDLGLGLAGSGLVALVACGYWIASEYAGGDRPARAGEASPLPVFAGFLAGLVLLVGVGLLVPWLVDRGEPLTRRGGLAWRLATRDATRHRGRTTAAVLAVGMLTTGAVVTGFAVSAQASIPLSEADATGPGGTAEIYLSGAARHDVAAQRAVAATAHELAGFDRLVTWGVPVADGRGVGPRRGFGVRVATDEILDLAALDPAARAALESGSALVARRPLAPDGRVSLGTGYGRRFEPVTVLPALVVPGLPGDEVWLGDETARAAGLATRPSSTAWLVDDDLAASGRGVVLTEGQETALRLNGLLVSTAISPSDAVGTSVAASALGVVVLTGLVVGLVVSLASAEGSGDAATLAAVGAPPRTLRTTAAAHAWYVGGLGSVAGLVVGSALGASLAQLVGTPGVPVPWVGLLVLLVGTPVVCGAVGWLVAPRRLALTRRTA